VVKLSWIFLFSEIPVLAVRIDLCLQRSFFYTFIVECCLSGLLLVRPKTIVFGRTYVLAQMFFSPDARSPRCVGRPAWNFARWSV